MYMPMYRCLRFKNKSIYMQLSVQKMVSKDTPELNKILKLTVDGRVIALPSLVGLVLLNIQSWAAGADPWGNSTDEVSCVHV